jgi:ABC-type branched-subunit amino acid transport system permease subunit
MAVFRSGHQWGIAVAFLVLLFASSFFCRDRVLTILTMMGIAVISVHGLNILTGYSGYDQDLFQAVALFTSRVKGKASKCALFDEP